MLFLHGSMGSSRVLAPMLVLAVVAAPRTALPRVMTVTCCGVDMASMVMVPLSPSIWEGSRSVVILE